MKISFYKYQGTGNDFVMIDNRTKTFPKDRTDIISQLCDRNFGVGADGVILIEDNLNLDFEMIYFNADGSQTFCGNGGRCAVAFAKQLGLIKNKTQFLAIDGKHFAEINNKIISLKMVDVNEIKVSENSMFAYTGTQHHVEIVTDLDTLNSLKVCGFSMYHHTKTSIFELQCPIEMFNYSILIFGLQLFAIIMFEIF